MVMFVELAVSPMTVELRMVPVVFTPGSAATKSSVLRVLNGDFVICAVVSVVETEADSVCTS